MREIRRPASAPSILPILLLCTVLIGCAEPGPEDALQTYLARLARTLDQPAPAVVLPGWQRIPRSADLEIDLEGSSLDALDFLSLSGCAVQVTIGKRNSSLGRTAPPSQRLLLDLEYLELAPDCVNALRGKGEDSLATTLDDAWQQKKDQLPARVFNATLASDEFRAFWRKPRSLAGYPADTNSRVVTALESLTALARQWRSGDYTADNRGFEILLSEVAIGDGGALMASLSLQSGWLQAADTVVGARVEKGPLCGEQLRLPEADILQNVVHKYFIGGVQPWSAAVGRRHHELISAFSGLEDELQDALPENYVSWREARDRFIATTAAHPREHVGELKQLLDPCQA
jgi:hypothetical protein